LTSSIRQTAALFALLFCIGVTAGVLSKESGVLPSGGDVYGPGFRAGEAGLNEPEITGRRIWFYATAGNDRFHTYVLQQRLGVLIDWYRVLNSKSRYDRFKNWGLVNDPDCCQPGEADCPAKSYEETYGFDWCPGDEVLLQFVGKEGYRDPACDLQDPGGRGNREDPCHLAFGTSTGALGFRKFPNPRFDLSRWRKLNQGQAGTWEGYNRNLSADPENADSRASRLSDGSIEPPFRVGMACGACHIGVTPLNPPKDPERPKWENISGTVGNQYIRISQIMTSGMPADSLAWQVFSHSRPGTTDTSAVPTDQVNNAGTINAIINFKQRPVFAGEKVVKWRMVKSCPNDATDQVCWCVPGKPQRCWRRSLQDETVHHILKGGEDSSGIHQAVQRVYFNLGSCSEQCWVNHLTDLRQLDPHQRGFGQTPFDIGQCRRDCVNFRAIEDRLEEVVHFLLSAQATATDLYQAKGLADQGDLVEELEAEYGKGAVERGRVIFAESCARCHSSQPGAVQARDFHAIDKNTGLRRDWMGDDRSIPVTEVGTNRCRALHSNHMKGHIWEEFGSETLRAQSPNPNIREAADGGRGYYRNPSLLSLWAHAPFLHDNSVGPEICGAPLYDRLGQPLANTNPPGCWPFDPSLQGRLKLFKASMDALLNPKKRGTKVAKLDRDIALQIGPRLWDGREERQILGFALTVPKGTPAAWLGNFQHKLFFLDLIWAKIKPEELEARLAKQFGQDKGKETTTAMREIVQATLDDPEQVLAAIKRRLPLVLEIYSSCTEVVEDGGHRFGEGLSDKDKRALTAFLATL
jgi:hypothetical protein